MVDFLRCVCTESCQKTEKASAESYLLTVKNLISFRAPGQHRLTRRGTNMIWSAHGRRHERMGCCAFGGLEVDSRRPRIQLDCTCLQGQRRLQRRLGATGPRRSCVGAGRRGFVRATPRRKDRTCTSSMCARSSRSSLVHRSWASSRAFVWSAYRQKGDEPQQQPAAPRKLVGTAPVHAATM